MPQEIFQVLMSVRDWVDSRATVRPEVLCQRKIPVTPFGIETVTLQLEVQCFNQLHHHMPLNILLEKDSTEDNNEVGLK